MLAGFLKSLCGLPYFTLVRILRNSYYNYRRGFGTNESSYSLLPAQEDTSKLPTW